MSFQRSSFVRRTAAAGLLLALPLHAALAAKPPAELVVLPANARVGVLNLLDAEVTHFHAARRVQDSALKTETVAWSVPAMLLESLSGPLAKLGYAPVPLTPEAALRRAREPCFLEANLQKSLSRECAATYSQLLSSEHLAALIVLGPGLNDGTHAQGTRRKDLPEYLRGWCVISGLEGAGSPLLLNLTELVLVRAGEKGAELRARAWGGAYEQSWTEYRAPPDPRALPGGAAEQLQPLFAALLQRQSDGLLVHLGPPTH
jgi:hypothetical protein